MSYQFYRSPIHPQRPRKRAEFRSAGMPVQKSHADVTADEAIFVNSLASRKLGDDGGIRYSELTRTRCGCEACTVHRGFVRVSGEAILAITLPTRRGVLLI